MSYPCDSDSYHMDRVPDKCICKYKPAFVVTCIKGTSALNCHLLRTSNPEYSTNELLLTVVCHKHPHFMDSWGEPLIQVCIYIKSYFLIVLKKKPYILRNVGKMVLMKSQKTCFGEMRIFIEELFIRFFIWGL